ncbi:hypothetical protein QEG98_28225 [Myxococcus sp. MxC21-1]|uniref:hypothetical protein n=1 Tax=Myxococcus sp. MxC21-1 TaxID=3041439 RepID=UPI00292DE69E|nr:hypothetical protein [Myxococcus sp. MxC21-1]WNZ59893.1 hypothetical protein QEG98_28225 [Myxococcus sp. MxC21-1]
MSKLWTAYGRQSLFLFKVPALAEWAIGDVKSSVLQGLGPSGIGAKDLRSGDGTLHEVVYRGGRHSAQRAGSGDGHDPELPRERVHKIGFEGSKLVAIVRIVRSITVVQEDEEREIDVTYDVQVVSDLESEARLTRVFGAQTDGRKSLRTVLRFLGFDVPERGRGVPRYMQAVVLSEPRLREFALSEGWEWVDVSGDDGVGNLGRVGYSGRTSNPFKRNPLDEDDERVQLQDQMENESRTYNFTLTHDDDDFRELSEVEFLFGHRQTRLGFPRRASRAAMEHVISRVYEHVA